MQDISAILCHGSLIAEVKACSTSNRYQSSIISNFNQASLPSEKIKLKCVMKNSELGNKKSPSKFIQKELKISNIEVNFDYFLFLYIDKHDNLEFREYGKAVRKSPNTYSSNFTIVQDITSFRMKFQEMKETLCHKKFSLLVSQFGMLNHREEFKEINEVHFFTPNQEKYSNVSFLMKESNLKSILYDFSNLDKLLQDLNVLKKEINSNELPSVIMFEKIKQFEIEKKSTFGDSTGFNSRSKNSSNKENSETYATEKCENSYENELKILRSRELNTLRANQSENNSETNSGNLPYEHFPQEDFDKKLKPVNMMKDEFMKRKKKSSLVWFKNYSKAISENNKGKYEIRTNYHDEIIENELPEENEKCKETRFSKTEDIFYRKKDINNF